MLLGYGNSNIAQLKVIGSTAALSGGRLVGGKTVKTLLLGSALFLCCVPMTNAADKGKLVLYCQGEIDSSFSGSDPVKKSAKYQITVDFDQNKILLPVDLRMGCSAKEVSLCGCSIKDTEFTCGNSGQTDDHLWSASIEVNRFSAKMKISTNHTFKNIWTTEEGWLSCERYNKAKF
jgi:hypothetical protein